MSLTVHLLLFLRTFYYPYFQCATEDDKFMVANPGKALTQIHVTGTFTSVYSRIATFEEAEPTFRSTGIHPLNPDISSDDDFAPSQVNERPKEPENQTAEEEGPDAVPFSLHGSASPSSDW